MIQSHMGDKIMIISKYFEFKHVMVKYHLWDSFYQISGLTVQLLFNSVNSINSFSQSPIEI
jgi:hypothetical protein